MLSLPCLPGLFGVYGSMYSIVRERGCIFRYAVARTLNDRDNYIQSLQPLYAQKVYLMVGSFCSMTDLMLSI